MEFFFFFQAEDGIRDRNVTGVQTCALPIWPAGVESTRLLREVAEKICRRIEWPTPVPDGEIGAFLREFYTAERGFLERDQLFGKPRADKHYQSQTTGSGPLPG